MNASFEAIYRAEFLYVWNSLRRLGIRGEDQKDLAHDVFVIAYRKLADYDPERPVRPWLFGIAFRVVAHSRRAARADASATVPEDLPSAEPSPEENMRQQENRALVARALAALDLDKRAVFVLHELDGQPIPEVARALEIPLNTAYSRLRLARRDFAAAVKRVRGSGSTP